MTERRRGQSLIEFSTLAGPFMVFLIFVTVFIFYLGGTWTLTQVTDAAARRLSVDGVWDEGRLLTDAYGIGMALDPGNDTLQITVRSADGEGDCGSATCVYGWGDDPVVEYGDLITLFIARKIDLSGITRGHIALPSIDTQTVTIAQRDTPEGGYTAPETTGTLVVTVKDQSLEPLENVIVGVDGGAFTATGANGKASFSGLSEGDVLVSAVHDGYRDAFGAATVTAALTETIDLFMSSPMMLYVYVSDGPGNEIALSNPDFEAGGTGGWSGNSGFTYAPETFGASGSPVRQGDFAGSFSSSGAGQGVAVALPALAAGEVYRGSVWVRAVAGTPIEVLMGSPTGTFGTTSYVSIGGWYQANVAWNPTAGDVAAGDAMLAIRDGRGSGTASVDYHVDEALVRSDGNAVTDATVSAGAFGSGVSEGHGLYAFSLDGTIDPFTIDVSAPGCVGESFGVSGDPGDAIIVLSELVCS